MLRDFGEALDVSWGGYEGNFVTSSSYVLGNLKEWNYVTKGQPWKQGYMKLRRISCGAHGGGGAHMGTSLSLFAYYGRNL